MRYQLRVQQLMEKVAEVGRVSNYYMEATRPYILRAWVFWAIECVVVYFWPSSATFLRDGDFGV